MGHNQPACQGEAISTINLGDARVVTAVLIHTLSQLPAERRVALRGGLAVDLFGPGGHGRRWTVFTLDNKVWQRHSTLLTIEEVRSLG